MAATISLEIDKNTTFTKSFVWKTGELQTPVDLTGCNAVAEIRVTYGSEVICTLSTLNSSIQLGGNTGSINLILTDEITVTLPSGIFSYDLLISFPDGSKKKLIEGTVTINNTITEA